MIFKETENSTIFVDQCKPSLLKYLDSFVTQHKINKVFFINTAFDTIKKYLDTPTYHAIIPFSESKKCPDLSNIIYDCPSVPNDFPNNKGYYMLHKIPENFSFPDNIIWDIEFKLEEWENFDNNLSLLIDKYAGRNLYLNISFQTCDGIVKHPCRAYMCTGCNCHNAHSNIPRSLYINSNGAVYPLELCYKEYKIGDIRDSFIIENYVGSKQHSNFISLNEDLFYSLRNKCSYKYIPWDKMLRAYYEISHKHDHNECL